MGAGVGCWEGVGRALAGGEGCIGPGSLIIGK